MHIAVIGSGYVGLVSGAGFANIGLDVTCVDSDPEKLASLERGEVPFYEPGLQELIDNGVKHGRLHFTDNVKKAVDGAKVVFLCVGTPMGDDGSADLSYVFAAAKEVAQAATGDLVLVNKSTVPVGSAAKVREVVREASAHHITVASNPEFLKEGNAVSDFLGPDRIVIGTDDETARVLLDEVYRPFMMREMRVIHMDIRSAELTKYAANGMLALRISFMNEIAALCQQVGANIDEVRKGIMRDNRIGSAFLYAGVGYGGSCFPKDVMALIHTGEQHDTPMPIMRAVDDTNTRQRGLMLQRLLSHFGGDISGKTFAIWGIAFKPRTDDIRYAPSIALMEGLLSAGAKVRAYDRAATANARGHFGDRIFLAEDEYAALDGADALVLMTEWPEFRLPSWGEVKSRLAAPVLFDGRNIYQPDALREEGFTYYGIGRPDATTA